MMKNYPLYTWTQFKVMEARFYGCSTFHSPIGVFNNDHHPSPQLIVKRNHSLQFYMYKNVLISINATSDHLRCGDVT